MEEYEKTISNCAFSCIMDIKNDFLMPQRMPKNFYQYSALSTFRGVIEHNNLWATHWAYLNDSKELIKGIEIAKFVHSDPIIRKAFKPYKSFSDFEKTISKFLQKDKIKNIDAYVLCFSEKKDELNLWRGYGDGYNSIVTAYDVAKMETNVKGIFACGNATGGLLQVCKSVYEGAQAGLSAVNYIRKGESLKVNDLDFLVVQWPGLSILPMQGTQVPSLVGELDPTCCN